MRVLHLFGDWKWTGPAEPTLDLCLELRALGVEARLACQPAPPEATSNLPARARERGLEPDLSFALNKELNLRDNLADIRKLREACEGIDLVHVHFTHDHIIAAMAVRPRRPLVRTNHRGTRLPWFLRRWTDGYLTYFRSDHSRAPSRLISPGMRLDRYDPTRKYADMRSHFGIAQDAFVLGIVARMQRHRRFDVLLQGIKQARASDLRVLVVGRGTHMQSVAVEPARDLRLDKIVTFTGYLSDRYLDTVAAVDALIFLVPGSDGTCRALREAMAMGKAAIGARRGMIPDIIDDGVTGLVIDDTPESIAAAIERLARDRELCLQMGRRGREKALARYDILAQAREVMSFYQELL